MRVGVVQELITIMRSSGYHGYEQNGINAPDRVAQRLKERYAMALGKMSFAFAQCAELSIRTMCRFFALG